MTWYYYFHPSITNEKTKLMCPKITKPVNSTARIQTQPVRFQNSQWFF